MADIGLYADLPMPCEWQELLDDFSPVEASRDKLFQVFLPSGTSPRISLIEGATDEPMQIADEAFHYLDEREFNVVIRRFGFCHTLDEIGQDYGLTRERVRQIEVKALRKIQKMARKFNSTMRRLFHEVIDLGFVSLEVQAVPSQYFVNTSPDVLWLCAFNVYKKLAFANSALVTELLPDGTWVIQSGKRDSRGSLSSRLEALPSRFLKPEEILESLSFEAHEFRNVWLLLNEVKLTKSGKICLNKWTKRECIEALAWELADQGFIEWHFSQMAKAVGVVFSSKFENTTGRNVSAILNRSDAQAFQQAGKKGYWQLRDIGDGYYDNKAAITAILQESDIPLHADTIYASLKRQINHGTVGAMLGREPEFQIFGGNIFGLAGKEYAKDMPEATWLHSKMIDIDSIEIEQMHSLARLEGIEPERVRAAAVLSDDICYVKGANYPATYQKVTYFNTRQFERWFRDRLEIPPPKMGIFQAGLQAAYASQDYQKILEAERAATIHGVELPDELMFYVDIAKAAY